MSKRISSVFIALFFVYLGLYPLNAKLKSIYSRQLSAVISDRNGTLIALNQNYRGYYAESAEPMTDSFRSLLLKKEDRLFYYHLGINPFSVMRDGFQALFSRKIRGSSTITQQLVKNLLGNENQRTVKNKIVEALYSLALELYTPKSEILKMYGDTAYFGNQTQGIENASRFYFNKAPGLMTNGESLKLLATLNNPSVRYPGTFGNKEFAAFLGNTLGGINNDELPDTKPLRQAEPRVRKTDTGFELGTLGVKCPVSCALTIDASLNDKLRAILKQNLDSPALAEVENGAIVVIKISPDSPENELLAIIGSPDTSSQSEGGQINMATRPRPIGSTAKPFIYLKAFEKGARPYTLVDDREYKYPIGTGFYLYPKNYDGKYRGIVTLHQALSNSLNVPTVKTLEFVGVGKFNDFLENTLKFHPRQELENYELGIALGGLEMDLLTLSHYLTIFPNEGVLKPLRIANSGTDPNLQPPMTDLATEKEKIADASFVELVNKILSDRATGVDQFGMKGNLNLTQSNYAVKTGTTYDYHDSWTIGYTPDFLVGVWVGNSSNKPIRQISGQAGAGKIWHDVMEFMLSSPYNKKSEFKFDKLKEFRDGENMDYGLEGDDYPRVRNLIESNDLILQPHEGDVFLLEKGSTIPLRSREKSTWFIDGKFLGEGEAQYWRSITRGDHSITAETEGGRKETVKIRVDTDETDNLP